MGVGMPDNLMLDEFGAQVESAFDNTPFHVGSSLVKKIGWRDVDVRLILTDEEYEEMGLGDPDYPQQNAKWVALCHAFSLLGRKLTGLPVDFQIQQMTLANTEHKGKKRNGLGFTPLKMALLKNAPNCHACPNDPCADCKAKAEL